MAERFIHAAQSILIKKTYLHDRKTDKKFRLNGVKETSRMPQKQSLHKDFSKYVKYNQSQLPHKVDLRPWMTTIEDQSDVNSCTANAMAGAYEYLNYKATNRKLDVSRLFIYYNARIKDLDENERVTDEGSSIPATIESMEGLGVCLESLWPYSIKKVNVKPKKQCYEAAEEYTITEALEVDIDINEMKSCLAQGFPIIIGLNLYSSFDKAMEKGIVPMPIKEEISRSKHGSHALLASGYSDKSQAFIVRNSWGEEWGDKGYCYVPYDYMTNKGLCNDAWTVKKLAVDDMGTDVWEDEDDVNYLEDDEEDEEEEDDDDADIEDVEEVDEDAMEDEDDEE
ncbi:unnamed protein product [Rotaria sordida]|uniref:Peptidase C1A papain C-terminal domain-containing protein n=1 Tax=Rotaria sordida TaxID=392033 RepID=A0A819H4Y4_9BILA|nr:unnamed protein product [Rotaria sordida]